MREAIVLGFLLGMAHGAAQAASVVPSFTTGTVTSETTTRTEVTEVINQVEYSTATSYTVTGTNIRIPDRPSQDSEYSQIDPTAAFQFTETIMTPGISSETSITRTIITDSYTMSTSVFTQ